MTQEQKPTPAVVMRDAKHSRRSNTSSCKLIGEGWIATVSGAGYGGTKGGDRIAKCLQACAGWEPEALVARANEAMQKGNELMRMDAEMAALRAQRDQLLLALRLAEGIAQRVIAATGFDESQVSDWRPVVRAAIANGGGA